MRRFSVLFLAILSLALVVAIAASGADRTVKVDGATTKVTWEGTAATGANVSWFFHPEVPGQCGKTPINYCDDTLVHVDVPAGSGAKLTLDIDGGTGDTEDVDAALYKSDASGAVGDFVDNYGEVGPEKITINNASGYYLVRTIYFTKLNSGYTGVATLTGAPAPGGGGGSPTPTPSPGATPTPTPSGSSTPTPTPTPTPTQTPGQSRPGELPASGTLTVSAAAGGGKRSTARKRGMRVRVRCSVQCFATAVAKVDRKTAKRLKLGKKAVRIGVGNAEIRKAGRIPFFVKLTKKAKKALARKKVKKFTVRMQILVTDREGKQAKRFKKKPTLR